MQDTNKNNLPIGVFDSGVGGLSVLRELKRLLPRENFIFFGDQLNVPYGEKSKQQLVGFLYKITDYLTKNHKVKMLVLACNTATCYAIDELREKYSFPIVGTVPALKPAALKTKTGTIAVISTPATSRSPVIKKLIENYCKGVKVINTGCKNLENAVEEGEPDSPVAISLLEKYLSPIKNSGADYLVLACTHYPFLKREIKKIVGPRIKLLDSGKAIARRTDFLLKTGNIKNKQKKVGETYYFTTGDPTKFSKVASKLLKLKIEAEKVKV